MLSRTLLIIAIPSLALLTPACSDDAEPAIDAATDTSKKEDTGGGGGDAGEDAAPPSDASGLSCRTYGTEGTLTAAGNSMTIKVSLDTTTLELKSEIKSATVTQNNVDTYASLADIVDEATVMGKELLTKRVEAGDFSNATTTYTYDASKRLIKREHTDATFTYSAWDSEGRPTAGTGELTKLGCGGVQVTITYDDQALTKTTSYHDPTSTCLQKDRTDQDKYNATGDWIGQVMDLGEPGETTATIEYTKSAQICK